MPAVTSNTLSLRLIPAINFCCPNLSWWTQILLVSRLSIYTALVKPFSFIWQKMRGITKVPVTEVRTCDLLWIALWGHADPAENWHLINHFTQWAWTWSIGVTLTLSNPVLALGSGDEGDEGDSSRCTIWNSTKTDVLNWDIGIPERASIVKRHWQVTKSIHLSSFPNPVDMDLHMAKYKFLPCLWLCDSKHSVYNEH